MNEDEKGYFKWAVVAVLLGLALIVHMTRYEYVSVGLGDFGTYSVRVDRITGKRCIVAGPVAWEGSLGLDRC